jgi:hypothetical protein
MAKVTSAELLRLLRAEADRVADIADRLRDAVETVADPTAAEAEVEAVRAAAEQRAAAAEAVRPPPSSARPRPTSGVPRPTRPRRTWPCNWPPLRPVRNGQRPPAALLKPTGMQRSRRPALTPPRGSPLQKPSGTPRSGRHAARLADGSAPPRPTGTWPWRGPRRPNRPPGWRSKRQPRAQAAAEAAAAETGRVRADADMTLASFRADAARDRDELRADLRARAERAGRQADAYRDELTQLRAGTSHDVGTTTARSPARTMPASQS